MPPGPPLPKAVQTPLQWLARPWWMAAVRRRYGNVFRLRDQISDTGDIVVLADPEDVKAVFTGSPEVFHAGEGNAVLGPLVGPHSVLLLDEDEHLRERKLQLPAFHGERIAQSIDLMREAAEREVAGWPVGTPFRLLDRTQALTLDIIVRVVLGVDDARRADRSSGALRTVLEIRTPHLLMWLYPSLGRVGPWKRLRQDIAHADALLYAEIAHRRAAGGLRGAPRRAVDAAAGPRASGEEVDDAWIRDELMTLLVAGHETTATGLAWAFERLLRHPQALERVRAGLDDPRDPYVDAVVKETLRVRPVIYNVGARARAARDRRGLRPARGHVILPSIGLLHRDEVHFPHAAAFRPERWLDDGPAPYTWIPFGGGVRRCLGATFALTEMAVVVRTVLQQVDLRAAEPAPERTKVHHITLIPAKGARVGGGAPPDARGAARAARRRAGPGARRLSAASLVDLAQRARLRIEDEAPDVVAARQLAARAQAGEAVAQRRPRRRRTRRAARSAARRRRRAPRANASSEAPCRPQPSCMTTTISSVPSSRCETLSERIASSVTSPPALRMMCASPRSRPSIGKRSIRVSMHASTATLRRGRGLSPGAASSSGRDAAAASMSSALGMPARAPGAPGTRPRRPGAAPRPRTARSGGSAAPRASARGCARSSPRRARR